MASKIKNIILFLGIGAVLVAVYVMFLKPKPATPNLVSGTTGTTTQTPTTNAGTVVDDKTKENSDLAKQFLSLLLSVRSINLDNQIFSEPSFVSLKDSTIVLVDDGSEGRPNPFAPIGSDTLPANAVFYQGLDTETGTTPVTSPNTSTPPKTPAAGTTR